MSNIPDCVIVDDCDREFFEAMGKWYIDNKGYCRRNGPQCPLTKKQEKAILMHRLVLERKLGRPIAPGMFTDHINGVRTDCSRSNLREVTHQQNNTNRRAKGYYWHKASSKWMARIKVNSIHIYLGTFDSEAEARAAYLAAKEKYHKIP